MKQLLIKNLIFLPINIPNPPNISSYLDTVPVESMIVDNYRKCMHIPLVSPTGDVTEIGKGVPLLIEWLQKYVTPWSAPTRTRVLVTEPYSSNAPHIDCAPEKFNTLQHKFRYVFQGKRDSLTFFNGDKTETIPSIDKPYMINGAWPHEMNNNCDERKYTLVLGAPWEPSLTNKTYIDMLTSSYLAYSDHFIESSSWKLPNNWKSYFEKKYKDTLPLALDTWST
tara:strand:- start:6654 stop:7325 length:672 start_codon:yes stop_codon:yes gene_type:complete